MQCTTLFRPYITSHRKAFISFYMINKVVQMSTLPSLGLKKKFLVVTFIMVIHSSPAWLRVQGKKFLLVTYTPSMFMRSMNFFCLTCIYFVIKSGAIFWSVCQTVPCGCWDFQQLERWDCVHVIFYLCSVTCAASPRYLCFPNFVVLADANLKGVRADQIIFTDVAAKNEHIRRSTLADLFLDT